MEQETVLNRLTASKVPFYLLERTHDLMKELYISLRQYPKSEKYGLAADTKKIFNDFLELVIRIKDKHIKKTSLEEADIKLDTLRQYLRLGVEFKYMAFKRYEITSKCADECGRIIGKMMINNRK